ncbi:MAG: hypothetical protein LBE57_04665 [Methanosarcinales archaeon]|jgi:hypothetical protein|nr:hypothetical protein [Methanosarcinales archaeon]
MNEEKGVDLLIISDEAKDFSKLNRVELFSFQLSNSDLKLLGPLTLKVHHENGQCILENELFEIFSFDSDFNKAFLDIDLQIQHLWVDFVLKDESKLAPSGVEFKKLLQTYVGKNDEIQNSGD